ncbi:hypothetical protein CAOG_009369 [Capsaspora owczarzaki ATCC 30864]|uniref:Uncharacterized protein n=1 Tax=Capsaspora owczarzaki (strain ATCC 30864) TaxID=595528 RepID=A0A0D2WJI3_CAPO3|nr:hypothetical protein CAOG_009369 [Capsaspora owczarzaki ATCC 30864]
MYSLQKTLIVRLVLVLHVEARRRVELVASSLERLGDSLGDTNHGSKNKNRNSPHSGTHVGSGCFASRSGLLAVRKVGHGGGRLGETARQTRVRASQTVLETLWLVGVLGGMEVAIRQGRRGLARLARRKAKLQSRSQPNRHNSLASPQKEAFACCVVRSVGVCEKDLRIWFTAGRSRGRIVLNVGGGGADAGASGGGGRHRRLRRHKNVLDKLQPLLGSHSHLRGKVERLQASRRQEGVDTALDAVRQPAPLAVVPNGQHDEIGGTRTQVGQRAERGYSGKHAGQLRRLDVGKPARANVHQQPVKALRTTHLKMVEVELGALQRKQEEQLEVLAIAQAGQVHAFGLVVDADAQRVHDAVLNKHCCVFFRGSVQFGALLGRQGWCGSGGGGVVGLQLGGGGRRSGDRRGCSGRNSRGSGRDCSGRNHCCAWTRGDGRGSDRRGWGKVVDQEHDGILVGVDAERKQLHIKPQLLRRALRIGTDAQHFKLNHVGASHARPALCTPVAEELVGLRHLEPVADFKVLDMDDESRCKRDEARERVKLKAQSIHNDLDGLVSVARGMLSSCIARGRRAGHWAEVSASKHAPRQCNVTRDKSLHREWHVRGRLERLLLHIVRRDRKVGFHKVQWLVDNDARQAVSM